MNITKLASAGTLPAPPLLATVIVLVAWLLVTPACGASDGEEPLVIYSGRSEQLIGPLLEQFTEVSGIEVRVKYGSTAELAATILEEKKGVTRPRTFSTPRTPAASGQCPMLTCLESC